jgi:TPP-dependent pyruvate/acetoin dehydrogenase alpha subunit
MERSGRAAELAAPLRNDDIGEVLRLGLFRTQFVIRQAEQWAYDLFLQNLVKGTSHLSLGQEAVAAERSLVLHLSRPRPYARPPARLQAQMSATARARNMSARRKTLWPTLHANPRDRREPATS